MNHLLPFLYSARLHLLALWRTRRYWIGRGARGWRVLAVNLLIGGLPLLVFGASVVAAVFGNFTSAPVLIGCFATLMTLYVVGLLSIGGEIFPYFGGSKINTQHWRETLEIAVLREAFRPMGLRIIGSRITTADTSPVTYGWLVRGKYIFEAYIPTQAANVSALLADSAYASDPDSYKIAYRSVASGLLNDGKGVLLRRCWAYQRFVRTHVTPQPGFGGMWLQRGTEAADLYMAVDETRYQALSTRDIPTNKMASMHRVPLSMIDTLYTPKPDVSGTTSRYTSSILRDPAWSLKFRREHPDLRGALNLDPYITAELQAAINAKEAKV